ncbi:AsmA family protein [Roseibium sediminicola]|uniref:AsmA family protein n=1 Tax=Roseibium sediminicola TaxID=2933272 RepID=A0ABT0H374_9HYPH|nr:AsmA family protein [Roseibium sp. CAU 1639]MCK7616124.1 AsmA family protein [Roseibium sp. CAU 1639]
MRRLLIGLGSLLFMLVTIVLVAPLFLPKDEIKRQVVEQVDSRLGWRLRLDGPVSLSLFPAFSLTADKVGIAGEAGADGIEFAKAERVQFGLAWAGLISGNIKVTGIALDQPDIYLEVGPNGTTSWEPRRDLPMETDTAAAETPATGSGQPASGSETASGETPASPSQGYLKSIGVDRLQITGGTVTWKDQSAAEPVRISNLDMTLNAPDLAGEVALDSSFTLQDVPLGISGSLSNPLGLAAGDQVPVNLSFSSGDNVLKIEGETGLQPARADLALEASGPSLKAIAALAGQDLATDPGAFSLTAQIAGTEAAISVADLHLLLGQLSLGGAADADLSGLVPEISGRLVLKDGSIADLLQLAGQAQPASGKLSADLAFETVGLTGEELIAGLDINGSVRIAEGEVGGLGLASAVGGDPEADRLTNLAMDIDLEGLENPISLSGSLAWRGEAFSLTGEAATAKLLAGQAAPVSVTVKSNRVSAGFNGQASRSGAVDGAVSIETADLRGLMAWMGQPLGSGGGLKRFKASGIFGVKDNTVSFEETRFTLDDTSGEANGRVVLAGKPSVTARLNLRELVLDPYLGGSSSGSSGSGNSSGGSSSGSGNGGGKKSGGKGWSTAPIDFSGLKAVDADFKLTTSEIRWDKIKIDNSVLSTTIKNGVLTANLEKLALYSGSGSGTVTLNGTSATPQVRAKFSLANLNAYPMLRDAADFAWIEGKANINLDVVSKGGSEKALVEGLNGTASYQFADGAIRGINIPQMVRGLSVETLLGWQANPSTKTDFSSLGANFTIKNGIAQTNDLAMIGPLIRMTGKGTTDMPAQRLSWRVEPKIVPTLKGQAPQPRRKGEDKKLAGLGVPIVIEGNWNDPRIYPDIKGILENPEAAYKQLEKTGGELISILKGKKEPSKELVEQANKVINQATGGKTQIDVEKVIEGKVDDEEVLKAVEEGFGLPQGLLGNVFGGKKKKN